jgi:hypothetical protein
MIGVYQLPMFEMANTIPVEVFQEGPGKWRAMIGGGWWMAIGSTCENACNTVLSIYAHERAYLERVQP